jgi:hypothetical protein
MTPRDTDPKRPGGGQKQQSGAVGTDCGVMGGEITFHQIEHGVKNCIKQVNIST